MKSKNGKCPVCDKDDSKMKGVTGMTIYSECLLCGMIFWQDAREMVEEPIEIIKQEYHEP